MRAHRRVRSGSEAAGAETSERLLHDRVLRRKGRDGRRRVNLLDELRDIAERRAEGRRLGLRVYCRREIRRQSEGTIGELEEEVTEGAGRVRSDRTKRGGPVGEDGRVRRAEGLPSQRRRAKCPRTCVVPYWFFTKTSGCGPCVPSKLVRAVGTMFVALTCSDAAE